MEDRDLIGRTLGEFVLGKPIGEGGFGTVYRSKQLPLGREVVVKVLHQRLQPDEAARRRFLREARLASWFVHPYSAHIYDFGVEEDGLP